MLVDPVQGQRARDDRREHRGAIVGNIQDHDRRALITRVPLLGVPEQRAPRPPKDYVGAARQRDRRRRGELEDPVDLLERVGEEDVEERKLRPVGHAADLFHQVREGL